MNNKLKEFIEWMYCIIIAVALALLIRYYLGTPTIVKQPSMYPTLKQNERLILNRWFVRTKNVPERGDIITFEAPSSMLVEQTSNINNNVTAIYNRKFDNWFQKFIYYVLELNKISYIKRVIGLPGDRVQILDGKVYINGEVLNEPYLQKSVITRDEGGIFTDLIVPENTVFVMGDNRTQSADSRRFGCVPLDKLEGKVLVRFWPLNKFGKVK